MADMDIRMKPEAGRGYAMSGKIMLSAIVILLAVIIFMMGSHLYARWYVIHHRRRQIQRRRQRRGGGRSQIVLLADNLYAVSAGRDRGLEKAVLDSLPVYLHSAKTGIPSECAVCLSEFEENEVVRHLPKCSHSFHTECIDMWFHSHSTCPLCRSPVEQVVNQMNTVNVQFEQPGSSSKSKSVPPCQHDDAGGTEDRRKGLDLTAMRIEVPPRRVQPEDDPAQCPTGFMSPGNGLAYLKRILTISIRSPTSGAILCETGSSSSMATSGDLESCTRGLSQDSS